MNGPVLRDIHVPTAPWWPLAPGWWLLLGVVVLICALVVAWYILHAQRGPLRAALREIDALEAGHAREHDDVRLVEDASRLMRRVALRVEPDSASQSGEAWRAFVFRHARDGNTRDTLDRLAEARFRARPTVDAPALLVALRAWCRDALRTPAPLIFETKRIAAKLGANDVREAEAVPLAALRARSLSLRPTFRRGKSAP